MAHTSIWVPGTIVQAEHPDRLTELFRKGWGTSFKQGGGFNWFHLPVATPFALGGEHLILSTVFVFYRATDGPTITNVHVYNGARRVQAFDGLHVAGEHMEMDDSNMNLWEINPPVFITSGLGISVGVGFQDCGEILFTGAGAHFQTEEQS